MITTLNLNRCLLAVLSIIFLFIMHVFMPNTGGVIGRPPEYLIWIGIGAIILLGILKAVIRGQLIESPFKIYLLLFAALLLSSSIFNPIKNLDMFLINSMRLLAGILLYFALLQFDLTAKERLSILLIIFASTVIESIIGAMQFFGLYRYIPITPAPEIGMVGGAFQQQNLFASWLATGLIISLYLITTGRFKNYHKWKKMVFWGCVALLSLNLILPGVKRCLFAAVAIMVMLISRARLYRLKKRYLTVWFFVFFVGILAGVVLLSVSKDMPAVKKPAIKSVELSSDIVISYATRILMYRTSLEMFKEKPLFGQGFANFGSLYMYYQANEAKNNPRYKSYISSYTSHPHNELLLIIAESGIAGMLAILILLYGFIKVITRYGKQRAGLYLALLMPLVAHMMLEYPLGLSTAHYLIFLIFLYMATSHFVKEKRLNLRKSAALLTIFISLIMYISVTGYIVKTFYDYMNMVIYYREHEEGKTPSVRNIEGAMNNIYLKNWAIPQYMFSKAEGALKDVEKNREFLEDFLKWSSLEKQRQPVLTVFHYDANVLFALGLHYKQHVYFDEAMRTLEEGLSLYPNDEYLKTLRPKIVSEAFKAIFQRS